MSDLPIAIATLAALILFVAFMWWRSRLPTQPQIGAGSPQLQNAPAFDVVCIAGPLSGQRVAFSRHYLTLGRNSDNDVVINSPLVSRYHTVLMPNGSNMLLKDSESMNGTWLLGQRIDQVSLQTNQAFQVGPCTFVLLTRNQQVSSSVRPSEAIRPAPVPRTTIQSLAIDDYERVRLLGEGGAATVYLCQSKRDGQLVAIKILHHSADPYFKKKFASEGEMGMQLQHPNIVRTLGSNTAGDLQYIILEYMAGASLRDRMSTGPIPIAEAIAIVGRMCHALQFAHQRGIFHRDLKPENILFNENQEAKLSDFGIARFTSMRTVTVQGMLIGTPDYMSYEQAKGAEVDGRSDQYSLAIVLYEMLTGVRPFSGQALTVVEKHLTEKPRLPRQINPSIPKEIERVIMRALDKNRAKRFPNMLAMASALGFKAPNVGTSAEVPSPPIQINQPQAWFVHIHTRESVSINGVPAVWGRDSLRNPQVSRQHAQTWFEDGQYFIRDMGSSNGTFVNGMPIQQPVALTHGSYVYFGPAQYQFLTG